MNVGPLRDDLLRVFAGQEVTIGALENHVLTCTPYREAHLRKPVLDPWETAKTIEVIREPNRRQFPPGTRIRFPQAPGQA